MVSKSKTYYVRDVPIDVWRKLRLRAMREGVTVQKLFQQWIQRYAEGK